jgi:hypothetical protein
MGFISVFGVKSSGFKEPSRRFFDGKNVVTSMVIVVILLVVVAGFSSLSGLAALQQRQGADRPML